MSTNTPLYLPLRREARPHTVPYKVQQAVFRRISAGRWLRASVFTALVLLGVIGGACTAAIPAADGPVVYQLPSALPSGIPIDDTIWFTVYPARGVTGPAPAIVLLHPIGESEGDLLDKFMHRLADHFAARGITCALMTLPFHNQRTAGVDAAIEHFIEPHRFDVGQAFLQSSSDVSTVTTWLSRQPNVDPARLGVVGISLGAIIAHLAMGQDVRLKAGVAVEGGGDLQTLYRDSFEVKMHGHYEPLAPAQVARFSVADPLHYVTENRPRHVLMIEAARDQYVPPGNATDLWNALGRPPIQWTDTNHFAFLAAISSLTNTSTAYLNRVWDGRADDPAPLPRFVPPTFKIGWLYQFDGYTTPDIQWEFLTLGSRRDHLSLFNLDLGASLRSPFLGLGLTVTPYVDLGVSHPLHGQPILPYLSFHYVL